MKNVLTVVSFMAVNLLLKNRGGRMTEEELERKAKAYGKENNYVVCCDCNYYESEEDLVDAYFAGAKENGVIWHDLRKNPDDLPDTNRNVYVQTKGGDTGKAYYHSEDSWQSYQVHGIVIAWCEIPKFEVEE